jgi:hypothetical protein
MAGPAADDESAIERLIHRYNVATDRYDFPALAACFTTDGFFRGAYGDWRMHDELEEFGKRALARAAKIGATRHFVTNVLTEVDGDRACSTSFILVTRLRPDGAFEISLTGEYEDELVKRDGEWLFRERTVHVDKPFQASDG